MVIILTISRLGKFTKPGSLQHLYHEYRNKNIPAGVFLSNYRATRFSKTKKDIIGIRSLPEYLMDLRILYNCIEHRYELRRSNTNIPIRFINHNAETSDPFKYAVLYLEDSNKSLIGYGESSQPLQIGYRESVDVCYEGNNSYILMENVDIHEHDTY